MTAIQIATTVSGREAHDSKITVYLTAGELLRLDATILELRRVHGLKVDRGRFVREALAAASSRLVAERLKDGS